MRASIAALAFIRGFESFEARPYLCPAGWWTYGFGAIRDGEGRPVTAATPPVDRAAAERLLARDVGSAEGAVLRLVRLAELNQARFDALVSFTFNLGSGNLQASTLRRRVNAGAHDEVPTQLARWVYGGGRKLGGLVRRREAEGLIYAGCWPSGFARPG